jgi:hypothetical protein
MDLKKQFRLLGDTPNLREIEMTFGDNIVRATVWKQVNQAEFFVTKLSGPTQRRITVGFVLDNEMLDQFRMFLAKKPSQVYVRHPK